MIIIGYLKETILQKRLRQYKAWFLEGYITIGYKWKISKDVISDMQTHKGKISKAVLLG